MRIGKLCVNATRMEIRLTLLPTVALNVKAVWVLPGASFRLYINLATGRGAQGFHINLRVAYYPFVKLQSKI